jgi:hypothetical protein
MKHFFRTYCLGVVAMGLIVALILAWALTAPFFRLGQQLVQLVRMKIRHQTSEI